MVKKCEYSVSIELCSELMKKPKNKQVIPKFFIIYLRIFQLTVGTLVYGPLAFLLSVLPSFGITETTTLFSVQILIKLLNIFQIWAFF